MPKKIIILTTGQPSTNPRMVKEYQALKEAGYHVKVYYSFWQQWASDADNILFAEGEINESDFVLVGGSLSVGKWTYKFSKILQKAYQIIYNKTGFFKEASLSRTTGHLITAAKNDTADLYIAHNVGALPAAVIGAFKNKAKVGFDAEDYHRGEYKNQQSKSCQQLISIENKYLIKCNYVTVASPLIGTSYKQHYSLQNFVNINNVFSKRFLQASKNQKSGSLSLFWFSQTIGQHRGLETVAKAMKLLSEKCQLDLYLMGSVSVGFDKELLKLSGGKNIHFLPPVSPNRVFGIAAQYDIGLSIEEPFFENRNVCLTNKLFTYLLAGNCIIFSDTDAQKAFLQSYKKTGYLFESGNEKMLAETIENLYNHREMLEEVKKNNLELAANALNWEKESKQFLTLIKNVLANT